MSGKVPRSKLARATKLYEDFTGHEPDTLDTIELESYSVGVVIGECDALSYTTVRDGKEEHYIHRFKTQARPLLCVSDDGNQIFLVGGSYKFLETGINDMPTNRRR